MPAPEFFGLGAKIIGFMNIEPYSFQGTKQQALATLFIKFTRKTEEKNNSEKESHVIKKCKFFKTT